MFHHHKDIEKAKSRCDHYAEVARDDPSESWVRSLAIIPAGRTIVQSRLAISSVQAICGADPLAPDTGTQLLGWKTIGLPQELLEWKYEAKSALANSSS